MTRDPKPPEDGDLDPLIADALRRAYAVRVELEAAARHLWVLYRAAGLLRRRSRGTVGVRRLAVAVLTGMMLITSSGAAVAVSRSTLPGDLLYPLKRGVEQAQLLVALGAEQDAELHLRFARERLSEARAAAQHRPGAVPRLVADALGSLQQAQRLGGSAMALEAEATRRATRRATGDELASLSGGPPASPPAAEDPPSAPPSSPPPPPAVAPAPETTTTAETATVTVAPPSPDASPSPSPSPSVEPESGSTPGDGQPPPDERSPGTVAPSPSERSGDGRTFNGDGDGDGDGPGPAKRPAPAATAPWQKLAF